MLLRCLGQSWQATEQAKELKEQQPEVYKEIIDSIVEDLQDRGLPLEAERLSHIFREESIKFNPDLVELFRTAKPLIPALEDWVKSRLS